MSKSYFHNKTRGTTLVEGLVALLVLSLGLIPAFGIILVANNFVFSIRNNLIAANLAQEGVEVARALRDANRFSGRAFDFGLGNGSYLVEWNSNSLLPVGSNPFLKVSSQGLYNYSSGTNTIFRRRLLVTKIDPGGCNCELRVVSEITWVERKGVTKVVNVESHLFDWR